MMSNLVDDLPWIVLLSFVSKTQKKNSDSRQHPHIYLWVSISRPVSLSLGLRPLLLAFELHMTCNFHMLVYHKWKKKINKRKSKWIHRASIMIMCKRHEPISQLDLFQEAIIWPWGICLSALLTQHCSCQSGTEVLMYLAQYMIIYFWLTDFRYASIYNKQKHPVHSCLPWLL